MPDLLRMTLFELVPALAVIAIALVILADFALDLHDRFGPAGRRQRALTLENLSR